MITEGTPRNALPGVAATSGASYAVHSPNNEVMACHHCDCIVDKDKLWCHWTFLLKFNQN